MDILKGLHQSGRTVIIITHDDDIAEQADRVIRIIDGRIEADYHNEHKIENENMSRRIYKHEFQEKKNNTMKKNWRSWI